MSTQTLIIIAVIVLLIVIVTIFTLRRLQGQQRKSSSTTYVPVDGDDLKNNQVYVGNLAYSVSEADLRRFFQDYGIITDVRIVRNNKTGRSKGFAFVTYKEITQANKSLDANGKHLQNRKLVVRIAKPRL